MWYMAESFHKQLFDSPHFLRKTVPFTFHINSLQKTIFVCALGVHMSINKWDPLQKQTKRRIKVVKMFSYFFITLLYCHHLDPVCEPSCLILSVCRHVMLYPGEIEKKAKKFPSREVLEQNLYAEHSMRHISMIPVSKFSLPLIMLAFRRLKGSRERLLTWSQYNFIKDKYFVMQIREPWSCQIKMEQKALFKSLLNSPEKFMVIEIHACITLKTYT